MEHDGVAAESDDTVFFTNWTTAAVVQVHQSFTARLSKKAKIILVDQ